MTTLTATLVSFALATAPPSDGGPLTVELAALATAPAGVVRLDRVATITGGTKVDRDRLGHLDVADVTAKAPAVVTRRQLEFRVSLAGFDDVVVLGEGPVTVTVALAPPRPADLPVLVKPRQRVTMTTKVGGAEVRAVGEAVDEGRLGQIIRLKNIDSLKVLTGTVVGPNAVEIDSGGRP